MSTFNDIRARFATILDYGLNEDVEKKDMQGLVDYLKGLKTEPRENTTFKIAGKVIPRPEIEKIIGKEGITFGDDKPKKLTGLSRINDNIEKSLDSIKDPKQRENAEELLDGLKKIQDSDTPNDEKVKLMGQFVENGWIKKNAGGTKLYVDTASTGLYRKVLGDKSSPKDLINVANDYGIDKIDRENANRITKKAMTGAKLFGDKKGKMQVKPVKNGVDIDGIEYKKQDIPSDKELLEIYGSEKEAKYAKKALEKYNKIVEQTQKAFQDSDNIETLSAVPNTPPTTPENREKLKNATGDIISNGFAKQLNDKKPTAQQKEIMDGFKNLKDIKDPKEYDEKIMELTGKMMSDEFMSTAAADVVEMVSYMRELNKGNAVYMPAASNFPLGDIVSISSAKIDYEKDSPEEIQQKIQLIMTGVETRSIKKGAGGASASGDKTELSEYKSYKNKSGNTVEPEEIKDDLRKLSNKEELYSGIFKSDNVEDTHNGIKDMAKKYDFDLEDPNYIKRKNGSIDSAIAYVKKKNQDIDEDALRAKYDAYYDLGNVYANAYNSTVDSQLFTNEVWKYDKKSGKATVDRTDGLNSISELKFEFNIGFGKTGTPSNPVPTRFKNTDRTDESVLIIM